MERENKARERDEGECGEGKCEGREEREYLGTLYGDSRQDICLDLDKETLTGNIHVEGGFLLPCTVDISVRYVYDSEERVYIPDLRFPLIVDPGDYMPGNAVLTPR